MITDLTSLPVHKLKWSKVYVKNGSSVSMPSLSSVDCCLPYCCNLCFEELKCAERRV